MNTPIIRFILVATLIFAPLSDVFGRTNTYLINPHISYQTIDGFGASDAWTMANVGLMTDSVRSRVADLLFSSECDHNGNPVGIDLSIWRFNIGAGSVEQDAGSMINPVTRTECFLTDDGIYDWTKQTGQRRFLKLAKERGVPYLLGFLNSPPVYFTQNGLATNTGRGGDYNLRTDKYDDFVRFMADVVTGLKEHDGVTLDYISPVNEPDGHWNWLGPNQEGTPATNREVARIARLLDKEFSARGIDTKIIIPEASDYRCLTSTHMTDWQRGYEIRTFFSPDSTETYVGTLKNLPRLIAGHSYWTNTPVENMKQTRIALNDTLKKYSVDLWQSEFCLMSNDVEIGAGKGNDRSMKTALYVARLIHHDLVYANARSWQWWRAVVDGYTNGLLNLFKAPNTDNDTIVESKLLWTMGNYSRFIRPGAVRIDISEVDKAGSPISDSVTDPYGLMLSAYKNLNGTIVLVAVNYSEEAKDIKLTGLYGPNRLANAYVTSDISDNNLTFKRVNIADSVNIPARSVVTFTD